MPTTPDIPADFDVADFSQPLAPGTTLLEASAGTGKTYTLAALFLRLLLERDLAVREILVTTFTIPATAELRERIRRMLREACDAFAGGEAETPFVRAAVEHFKSDAPAMRARVERALREFDDAAIHTIHSFCQRTLQDRAFESAACFDFELRPDQSELVREIAEDYWRREFYECPACLAAAALAEKVTPRSFVKLLTLRLDHPVAAVLPAPEGELADARHALVDCFRELQRCWGEDLEKVRAFFLEDNSWALGNTVHSKPARMAMLLDAVAACLRLEGVQLTGFEHFSMFARSRVERATRAQRTPPCHDFFDLCEELAAHTARFVLALRHDFLRWAPAELARRKQRLNVASFCDLLTRLLAGLDAPGGVELAQTIRGRFRAALIDEFQDTDAVQERIFTRVFSGQRDGWLFLIGDPKQAIYGFRSADVFTYLDAAERADRRHTLGTNFRSASPLVAATNHLFNNDGRAFVLDRIRFQPVQSCGLRDGEAFSGDGVAAPLRIWRWSGDGAAPVDQARQQLIDATAAEIARILQGGARLGERPVVPADIAVLTRTNPQAQAVQAALAQLGVPSVLLSNGGVFDSAEAQEILAILCAAERPADEARLRAALLTDALGVTAAELHALGADERGWERHVAAFQAWRELWAGRGFIPMFRRLVRDAGIRARLLARPDGERRLTNFLHLGELLAQAAAALRLSPAGLIKWLSARIAGEGGEDEHELRLERDEDAVRIVTVHKSKGLEYNIVFCPFAWSEPREDDHVRFHDPANDFALTLDLGSPALDEHRALAKVESLAEDMRLLYVALTRARHRCDLAWGQFKGSAKSAAAWLLHRPPECDGDLLDALGNRLKELPPEQWQAELHAIAERSNGAVAVVDVPSPRAPRYVAAEPAGEALRAREFGGKIERDWCVSSFTSLTAGHDAERPDYDFAAEPAAAAAQEDGAEPEGIHAFPCGARSGVCLHEVFEELDFTAPETIAPLVRRKLRAFSFGAEEWGATVAECIRRTLAVRLPCGFSLGDVPPSARLTELEFHLPAEQLDAATLRTLLAMDASEHLAFSARRGWLKGFIDLVFEREGRFYFADWKSNRLGARGSAYTPAALAAAMARDHYGLQLHLYAVALHRYLGWRLGERYDFDAHFGGAIYVFLRGVDPEKPERGIHFHRPSRETIASLDRWLHASP